MVRKKMEGSEEQKRAAARDAAEQGQSASEIGGTTGGSKQRTESERAMSHQEKLDLKREGKLEHTRANTPEARPGSRDADSSDRERHPRLND